MKRSLFLLPLIAVFFFACSKDDDNNPAGPGGGNPPADTVFSLFNAVASPDTLPDTLYYGGSVTFQVLFGDTDGGAVTATVSGLPAGLYNIASSGDTTFVTLNIEADSLCFDSLYDIRIHADGGGADTLTLAYPMMVIDTSRIGGIRKLTTGMWWRETAYDTLVSVFDSANVQVIIRDTLVHKKTSRVTGTWDLDGETYYVITTADTMNNGDSTASETLFLRHTDSIVEIVLAANPFGSQDTLRLQALALPLRVGGTWETITFAIDTQINFFTFPVTWGVGAQGTAEVADTVRYGFAGVQQKCWDVSTTTDYDGHIVADTDIVFAGDTLVYNGDTAMVSKSTAVQHQYFSVALTIPIYTFGTEVKFDTNKVDQSVKRDTLRSGGVLEEYYDPRTGDTLRVQ